MAQKGLCVKKNGTAGYWGRDKGLHYGRPNVGNGPKAIASFIILKNSKTLYAPRYYVIQRPL